MKFLQRFEVEHDEVELLFVMSRNLLTKLISLDVVKLADATLFYSFLICFM
jgi:hypothetical protein